MGEGWSVTPLGTTIIVIAQLQRKVVQSSLLENAFNPQSSLFLLYLFLVCKQSCYKRGGGKKIISVKLPVLPNGFMDHITGKETPEYP